MYRMKTIIESRIRPPTIDNRYTYDETGLGIVVIEDVIEVDTYKSFRFGIYCVHLSFQCKLYPPKQS